MKSHNYSFHQTITIHILSSAFTFFPEKRSSIDSSHMIIFQANSITIPFPSLSPPHPSKHNPPCIISIIFQPQKLELMTISSYNRIPANKQSLNSQILRLALTYIFVFIGDYKLIHHLISFRGYDVLVLDFIWSSLVI